MNYLKFENEWLIHFGASMIKVRKFVSILFHYVVSVKSNNDIPTTVAKQANDINEHPHQFDEKCFAHCFTYFYPQNQVEAT